MKTIHVWPQEVEIASGQMTRSALVEDVEPFKLWFRSPEQHADLFCDRAESFVAATILLAMRRGAGLRIHAPISPSFLRNLEELQAIWSCWKPEFRPIQIEADSESESTAYAPDRAISMFSGGVDSCYTVWRHKQKLCGRRVLPLQTSIMVHGSEIGLEAPEMFERALQRSQNMLSEAGINLVRVATNFRYVMTHNYPTELFASMLAATLLFFQESHTTGLIPASFSYHGLVLPYASNPLTDPLYGTARFPIEHDGAVASRAMKMREIIAWPSVVENLRVCNSYHYADVNCGQCEKCVRNILTLRVIGIQNPPCFPHLPSDKQIEKIHMRGTSIEAMERLVKAAQGTGVQDSWLASAKKAVRHNKFRARWEPTQMALLQGAPKPLKRVWQFARNRGKSPEAPYVYPKF